jgi:predicted helicase
MVYGLFSARCMLKTGEGGDSRFEPREAIDAIPSTNPFLQKLLKESFSRKDKLSLKDKLLFDELDLGDITSLLQHTDTDRILEDFNRQTGGGREDPVIYFYEGFLNAYEKEQKKRRGVYYTPQPVVSFMVRAVDDILKTEFGIKDGLASTATKTIKIPGKKNGKPADDELWEVPAIQILDPAVGTGTFLRQTILQIWDNFKSARPGATKNSLKNQWNAYVKDKLLPRLNGFELMMAPYAVAHMKLAMCLDETGYAFDEDLEHPDRVKVFLTNSLEEADKEGGQVMMFEHDALTEESLEARKVKKNRGINVVIGNPPYSGESANKGDWILSLLDDYKKEPGGIEKLKEKNPKWINDDYVKFIRYAQVYVERAGSGIVAFINNHSFLDNPTFRGMRWNLLRSFDKIYIIDLHGNAKKKETTPDGSKDENVFDIQQGVSINIFIKRNEKANEQLAEVLHYDLYGLREEKYHFLNDNTLVALKWTELPSETPQYFLAEKNFANQDEYKKGFAIQELFSVNNVGIVTARDEFTIHYTKKGIKNTIEEFLALDDEDARNKFNLGKDVRDWKVSYAREDLEKTYPDKGYITEIAYRPFDTRWTFYTGQSKGFHCYPRENVMRHFLSGNNSGLALCRQFKVGNEFYHVFVSNKIIESSLVSNKTSEITSIFPLYLYPEEGHRTIEGKKRKPNLNITIVNDIANKLNLAFEIEKSGDKDKFAPVDLLDYIYAVLHSPAYRETYREFLKIDFPRIPYPADRDSFWKLVSLGGELRRLHLLESPVFDAITLEPGAAGKVPVEKIRYVDGKVFVNDVFFFANVPQAAWEFYIGGYQPAQKWLKDRKGRLLSGWDISHYRKIILALTETARVMEKIDRVGVV